MAQIVGTSGNDTLPGGAGNDGIFGLAGHDSLSGRAGMDTLDGGSGNDRLLGESGNDLLRGGTGNDTMFGGDGRDLLVGGRGRDFMTGGRGADTFAFDDHDSGDATAGPLSDVIFDFSANDILDLRAVDALFLGFGPNPQRGELSVWTGLDSTYVSWNTFGVVHDIELRGYTAADVLSQVIWYNDDNVGRFNTSARIAPGQTRTGTLEVREDEDFFRLEVTDNQIYTVRLRGAPAGAETLQDTYLALYDSNHDFVSDAFGVGLSPAAVGVFSAGTYFLQVDSFGDTPVGDYRLSVEVYVDDYAGNASTTGEIAAGETRTGEIGIVGDEDWFRIDLTEDEAYVFELRGADSGSGSLPDPVLVLYDAAGNFIDYNDDWNSLDSRLEHTASATGTYFLAAEAYADAYTGTYELSAALDDPLTA